VWLLFQKAPTTQADLNRQRFMYTDCKTAFFAHISFALEVSLKIVAPKLSIKALANCPTHSLLAAGSPLIFG